MAVGPLCRLLGVSPSAYYRWQKVGQSARERRNSELLGLIQEIYRQSRQTYGSPRLWDALRERGIVCSRKRVARLMHLHGIQAKTKRRFKVTTHASRRGSSVPDLVQRNFTAEQPKQVWTSDITYLWTREGWMYLAVVLDLYSRMIVGWEAGSRLTADLVCRALQRALRWRRCSEGLILHSDRGIQYDSNELKHLAKEHSLRLSMGRKGSCYDNAVTESFFHTLKTEHVYFADYQTRHEARTSIFDYIETFYNSQRKHSTLGNRSPMQFENYHNES